MTTVEDVARISAWMSVEYPYGTGTWAVNVRLRDPINEIRFMYCEATLQEALDKAYEGTMKRLRIETGVVKGKLRLRPAGGRTDTATATAKPKLKLKKPVK